MTTTIPLTMVARNEARAIGPCLDSLLASARAAQARLPIVFDLLVVLDDCTDETRAIAQTRNVRVLESHGGKVEGQRRGFREGAPFQIFADADILLDEYALFGICDAMLRDPQLLIAFPRLAPLPPRARTPLAWALHLYNLRRGFSSGRSWFNGRLFALRGLALPSRDELSARARDLPPSRFLDLRADLLAEDILLSRLALIRGGENALRESQDGLVRYRAPETLRGMHRYHRRMRRELERTDALFPETREVHARFGHRSCDLLAAAPRSERLAYRLFQGALALCRVAFAFERICVERGLRPGFDPWPAIEETKAL